MSAALVVLGFMGALGLMVMRSLLVDELKGRLARRITASIESTIAALPAELQAEWADEWRAELAAVISMPLTAAQLARGLRHSARELTGARPEARAAPIRWRLAGGSALLTLVILSGLGIGLSSVISQRLYDDFRRESSATAERIWSQVKYTAAVPGAQPGSGYELDGLQPPLELYANHGAIVRIVSRNGLLLDSSSGAKSFRAPESKTARQDGYLVETRALPRSAGDLFSLPLWLQYARPLEVVDAAVWRVRVTLIVFVLVASGLMGLGAVIVTRGRTSPRARDGGSAPAS